MIAIGSTVRLFLKDLDTGIGLYDPDTDVAINDATVTATLQDEAATVLHSFSLTSTGTNGVYQGEIPASVTTALHQGKTYNAWITATKASKTGTFLHRDVADFRAV